METIDLDVAIIGGGITGLTCAFSLLQQQPGLRVRVFESSGRLGGKIAGSEVAGIPVDTGPDAFLARVPGGVELASALGLADELVAPSTGKAYVWSRGKVRALPDGLVLGVPTKLSALARSGIISPRGIARAALDEVRSLNPGPGDQSVTSAVGRHLGREVVERLVDPLLGGINASNCDTLSLLSAAPNVASAAAKPRLMRALRQSNEATARGQIGVTEQRPVFLAPRTGIRTLISALAARVPHQCDTSVSSIIRTANGYKLIINDHVVDARMVVCATPARVASTLLRDVAPGVSAALDSIRTSSVALTLLAYPQTAVQLPPGSGMLVPRPENRLLTASSWWNQKWPHLETKGHVLIRASAGRDGDLRFQSLNDDELVKQLHAELANALSIRTDPVDARVTRWIDGFPQYDVGHTERVAQIEQQQKMEAPGLFLAGASYRGIGIPACIRDAQRAAGDVLSALVA